MLYAFSKLVHKIAQSQSDHSLYAAGHLREGAGMAAHRLTNNDNLDTLKTQVKLILNFTRTHCDYLFIFSDDNWSCACSSNCGHTFMNVYRWQLWCRHGSHCCRPCHSWMVEGMWALSGVIWMDRPSPLRGWDRGILVGAMWGDVPRWPQSNKVLLNQGLVNIQLLSNSWVFRNRGGGAIVAGGALAPPL
jgi:hypothetical protein